MNNYKSLKVFYNEKSVGTLALTRDNLAAFEYDKQWIEEGFSISPYSLPLVQKVFLPKIDPFDGLFGVFNDTLPDGWGRLLVDRLLLKKGINPHGLNSLDRLAIVQNSGMGAISFKLEHKFETDNSSFDLDTLSLACEKILNSSEAPPEELDELFKLGGSSGGARPKILTKIDNEDWIIKFPSSLDPKNIGEIEYNYSLCAKECGINMPETRLFPSKICSGYFGVKRFDRVGNKKLHMVSVSGLLETSHRYPNLDYNDLMKLTLNLTHDYQDVEQLFKLMCFNVFAHNRDDHSKNFSFIFDDKKMQWHLSPAYDLTYSSSFGGEHATRVNYNGKNPDLEDILAVAKKFDIKEKNAKEIALFIKEKTSPLLN